MLSSQSSRKRKGVDGPRDAGFQVTASRPFQATASRPLGDRSRTSTARIHHSLQSKIVGVQCKNEGKPTKSTPGSPIVISSDNESNADPDVNIRDSICAISREIERILPGHGPLFKDLMMSCHKNSK